MDEPPTAALTWAAGHLARSVTAAEPMGGGITRTKWRLHTGPADSVVLRWSDPAVWGAVGREHVRREVLALRLLADRDLPLPRLLAADLDGPAAGGPAALMDWLNGDVRLDPLPASALASLADIVVAVHAHLVEPVHRPPPVTYRGPAAPAIPSWARDPGLWRAAVDLRSGGPPASPYGLLHRDLHFGNVVWRGDAVAGILDWAETSWGPAELDVAHLSSDLAMLHGVSGAGDFRLAYRAAGGRLDPAASRFWQVADILGFLPDPAHILPGLAHLRPDLTAAAVRSNLEDLLAATMSSR